MPRLNPFPLIFAQITVRVGPNATPRERRKLLLNTLMYVIFLEPPVRVATRLATLRANECEKQVRLKSSLYSWYPRDGSLCCFLVLDLEVSKGVGILRSGNDSQELFQVLLLKVLLGQVLKVSLGEGDLGLNNDGLLVG